MSTEKIKEYIGTQLKALTSIASPTGFTKNATDYLMKQLEAMGYAPQLSNKGNVSVEIGGVGAHLVLAAHDAAAYKNHKPYSRTVNRAKSLERVNISYHWLSPFCCIFPFGYVIQNTA